MHMNNLRTISRAAAAALACTACLCMGALTTSAAITNAAPATEPPGLNVLKNSKFNLHTVYWRSWQFAQRHTNWVNVVTKPGEGGDYHALCIADADGSLVGVQQTVNVVSGKIYRLSGSARSVVTNSSAILFGGRIFFRMSPQPEYQLTWSTEFNQWWRKKIIITNTVTGVALVVVHMGYGNKASTGEFADVRLERLN